MKKYSVIISSLFLSVKIFGLSGFSWENVNDASAKLKQSYEDVLSSNLLKDIYKKLKESKTPYGDNDDYYFYDIDHAKAKVSDVLKTSDNKDEITQAKDVEKNINNFKKHFKQYDSLTNDPRVINAWRQDRKDFLDLIIKDEKNNVSLNKNKLEQLKNNQQVWNRLLKDYKNEEGLKQALRDEFIVDDKFDEKRWDLEKALADHALAEASFLINQQNLKEKILHGAVIGDREEAIGHKSIRDFAKRQDNSKRDMYQKEADIYSKASDYVNDQYVNLKKQYDIDQSYNQAMNDYRKQSPKEFSRGYSPNLIDDTRLNYDMMKKNAEKNKAAVRDLEKSWLSNLKFYTMTGPSYGVQYYGNKASNNLGLTSKFAESLKNGMLYIPSKIYSLLPSLSYPVNNPSQDSQNNRLKDKEFAEQLLLITAIKERIDAQKVTIEDIKKLYFIESELRNSFELRRRAKNLLTKIALNSKSTAVAPSNVSAAKPAVVVQPNASAAKPGTDAQLNASAAKSAVVTQPDIYDLMQYFKYHK